jgi:hypothetical protein
MKGLTSNCPEAPVNLSFIIVEANKLPAESSYLIAEELSYIILQVSREISHKSNYVGFDL